MFKQYGPDSFKNCDISSLRILGSVGEIIDEPTWLWYHKEIGRNKCPIVDTYWQTETGAIIITSLPGIGPTTSLSIAQVILLPKIIPRIIKIRKIKKINLTDKIYFLFMSQSIKIGHDISIKKF
jgi:acyl-coenzyme A synthetase/AMP-(fatty) acid ligase